MIRQCRSVQFFLEGKEFAEGFVHVNGW
jgi:hypothetical protein